MSPSQRNKLQNMESYRIDYANRDVTRNFSKKFKFQTRSPFQLEHSIVLRQNKYFMEIIIESDTTLLFLQSVAFNVNHLDLDLLDLNPHEEEMVGSVMKKKEKRSFIFAIFPKNEHIKIKKTDKTGIGTVTLKWQNTFGDIGDIVFGPFIYMGESDKEADLKAEDLSKQLVLDEPVWVKVSPLETVKQKGKVELDIDADNIEGISIHSLP